MGSETGWLTWMRESLRPGMTALDVGANSGLYTKMMAEAVGPTGLVVAVEPMSQVAGELSRNLAKAGYLERVAVVITALADKEGACPFYVDGLDSRQNSLASDNLRTPMGAYAITVATCTMDSLLDSMLKGRVDVVKVDAQGAECLVLRGAERVLAQPHLRLQLEIWPWGLPRVGGSIEEVVDRCEAAGLTAYNGDRVRVTREDILEAVGRCHDAHGAYTGRHFNLVFLK